MIRKSGIRFSEKIMRQQKLECDRFNLKRPPLLEFAEWA